MNTPFFYTNPGIHNSLKNWILLVEKLVVAGMDVPEKHRDVEWTESESIRYTNYCIALLNMHQVFQEITSQVLTMINSKPDLKRDYSLPGISTETIVKAQIFQFLYPQSSMSELTELVDKHQSTVAIVVKQAEAFSSN